MGEIRTLEDLKPGERERFDKAVVEGDSDTRAWEDLMLAITLGSNGNGDAYERRQAVRRLYAEETAR